MSEPTELLTKQVMTRMTPGLFALLAAIAKRDRRSISDVIRLAVETYVNRRLGQQIDEPEEAAVA